MRLTAREIAAAVSGRLAGPDVTVEGATQDSRHVGAGMLFVPIVAARDGHDFIADAARHGAVAYLTARGPLAGVDATAIEVADTQAALRLLGAAVRARFAGPVVGITGSAGKTSTKDLVATALRARRRVHASDKSFNNEIGVPLTMLNAPDDADAWVLEMGARGPGHIRFLCDTARPTIGVVTIVAAAHVEMFGSLDAIAKTKGELIESLPAAGAAVLNADDPRVAAMAARTAARCVTYGRHGDVRASNVELAPDLTSRFDVDTPWGAAAVQLGARGAHNVANALAAIAVAGLCGISPADLDLSAPDRSPWRMELTRAPSGAAILNDAYNANPASMTAALESLAALPAARRIAVLGPMAELGAGAAHHHADVAALARTLGIEVIAFGTDLYGMAPRATLDEVAAALGPLGPADAVLVKASRVAGLERLAALLAR